MDGRRVQGVAARRVKTRSPRRLAPGECLEGGGIGPGTSDERAGGREPRRGGDGRSRRLQRLLRGDIGLDARGCTPHPPAQERAMTFGSISRRAWMAALVAVVAASVAMSATAVAG